MERCLAACKFHPSLGINVTTTGQHGVRTQIVAESILLLQILLQIACLCYKFCYKCTT